MEEGKKGSARGHSWERARVILDEGVAVAAGAGVTGGGGLSWVGSCITSFPRAFSNCSNLA